MFIFLTMQTFQNFARIVSELEFDDETHIGWSMPSHQQLQTVHWLWSPGGKMMNLAHTCLDLELTSKDGTRKGRV